MKIARQPAPITKAEADVVRAAMALAEYDRGFFYTDEGRIWSKKLAMKLEEACARLKQEQEL